MIIICPKCGRVKEYGQKEYIHRTLYFDEDGEGTGSSEDVEDRCEEPRCVNCRRIVKFYKEAEDDE